MLEWVSLAECHRLPAVCGVYIVRHRESGKEYVGKSTNVRRRVAHHRRARGENYLYRAVRAHGVEAFEVCLFGAGTELEVTQMEIDVIAARGTFNPAGYNQTLGGDGISGYRYSDAQRAAVVARQTGRPILPETKVKMREARLRNNPFKGQKHSPETLEKIREAGRSRAGTMSAEGRAAIAAANAKKKGTKTRPHSEETRRHLSQVMAGVPKPPGYVEKYLAGKNNPMYGVRGSEHPAARGVLVWVPGSFTPIEFGSSVEAANWAGTTRASVCDWCAERYRPKNGYCWAYA